MNGPTFTLPTDLAGWLGLLLLLLSFISPVVVAQIIRRKPGLDEKARRRLSVAVPLLLTLVGGWPLLVWLGYLNFDLNGFSVALGAGIMAAGGTKLVYNEALDFWHEMSTPPAPPTIPAAPVWPVARPPTPDSLKVLGTRPEPGDEG